ncbi:hypothetical protein OCH239_10975 [Roseivivax halodurans JCM 10272]|uniref:Uncharacterized protein n=1 Tax=Roseivivax halodurans JCM 10272 TaxID=1449350 RepID=X7EE05_9RHOB|nr:hypothetical protein [Roseivivax halodurans]ETX13358.1 hypothetical protein OCH239_10975 [Roseivivax halodurans JCM 10272]
MKIDAVIACLGIVVSSALSIGGGMFVFSQTYGESISDIKRNTGEVFRIQTALYGQEGTGGIVSDVTELRSFKDELGNVIDDLESGLDRMLPANGRLEEGYGAIGEMRTALLGGPGVPGIEGELSTVAASLRDFKSEWDRDPRIRETLIALEKDVKQVLPLSVRAEFQEEVAALRSEIETLRRQVDDLEGRNDLLLSENAEYTDRIASLERDADALAELDALLAATRDQLSEQLSASIDEEEAAAGRVQELETQVSALRAAQSCCGSRSETSRRT